MNGSIRVSAKTVDDAITEALIRLGVTSDQLEYEVIEKGSAGFLGIGMKQAVIEARRKEKKEEIVSGGEKAPSDVSEVGKENNENQSDQSSEEERHHKEEVIQATENVQAKEPVVVDDDTILRVETFIKDTLGAMHIEASVETTREEEGLYMDISGPHMGIVIGKRGQTLDSLQYLANRVANKGRNDYIRVRLDTENYRSRREETLRKLANSVAHKVKKTRRTEYLEPMNPYERRIIHSALQNDPYVTTHSEGEEPFRKVVVTLKPRTK